MLDFSVVEHLTTAATIARGSVGTGDLTVSTPMPALLLEWVTAPRSRTLGRRRLFGRANLLLSSVGIDVESAVFLSRQAHAALDGFKGVMGVASPTVVQSCLSQGEPTARVFRDGDLVRYVYTESFDIRFTDES